MRTLLICHDDDVLNRQGLARWLASFSDLGGIVALQETKQRLWRRIRREIRRVGLLRFIDVLAFRFYYKLFLQKRDHGWEQQKLAALCATYPLLPADTRILHTRSPNTPEAEKFIRELAPDVTIARCKTLLKASVFSLATKGTFVMHPGICPEYRNAHGCFWALAQNDVENVGMTLLKIDKGVDTGPVYGYFRLPDAGNGDSHVVIQHRVVFDNLGSLQSKLLDIDQGCAIPLNTAGRKSREWGQPWLTAYWAWQRRRSQIRMSKSETNSKLEIRNQERLLEPTFRI
jgi:hypothetical protein